MAEGARQGDEHPLFRGPEVLGRRNRRDSGVIRFKFQESPDHREKIEQRGETQKKKKFRIYINQTDAKNERKGKMYCVTSEIVATTAALEGHDAAGEKMNE